MKTPIADFVRNYAAGDNIRLHMPGHKGRGLMGFEAMDLTEIDGADSLYEAGGIIEASEENASALFSCRTLYSTEGSSQCIRAMLYMALMDAEAQGKSPLIAAGRNAHKTFVSACALLGLEVEWIYPENSDSYLRCDITPHTLERLFENSRPTALYITSPDYLGNTADIEAISKICHKHGCLLLVDNAHGAYLRFLLHSRHPMDSGADICCDSAHKTLPVLTGGAYLHIGDSLRLQALGKSALELFGSTSPSYLILQSLDLANRYISEGYPEKLRETAGRVLSLKSELAGAGYRLLGDEELKISIAAKGKGYEGGEMASYLMEKGIYPEFYDRDYIVFMITPENTKAELQALRTALLSLPERPEIREKPPVPGKAGKVMSVREAVLSLSEEIDIDMAEGRVLASANVGCPPAVPVICCGERIDRKAIECFKYYGINSCMAVKNPI